MIILIEGVDGSGKTTLVKELSDAGYKTASIESSEKDFYDWCDLNMEDDIVVTDRSFISDLVYRIVDGKERRGMDLYNMALLLDDKCKIVFCESGTEYDDSIKRGEDNIRDRYVSQRLKETYRTVKEMVRIFTSTEVFTYNWREMNLSDVIKFIEERR